MRISLSLLFLTFSFVGFSQFTDCYEDEFIIQLKKGHLISNYLGRSNNTLNTEWDRCLHQGSNIHLIRTNSNLSASSILDLLKKDFGIQYAMQNCMASPRSRLPNDPLFEEQWGLEKIQASDLWELGVGEVTPLGDSIVVAIMDEGFSSFHEDLIANLWYNTQEIPGDNIDNDDNGYIDDYQGLNLLTQNDQHPTGIAISSHGTSVAGIIGARGNNEKGIAGVSWGAKLMMLSRTQSLDLAIEALYYTYEQRKKYNLTAGAEGSFVVVTNYSQGVDFLDCTELPLFDQAYDSLGQVGILNVVATTNTDVNVDQAGDFPSTCQSDFLITVTNIDKEDMKVLSAGFGAIHVDIGAPSGINKQGSWTCYPNDSYETFWGTSGAAPHVTGAVALLYSTGGPNFQKLVKTHPAKAALAVKKALLEGVDKLPSLNTLTVSEGRLNVWKAYLALDLAYRTNNGSFSIRKAYPNPTRDNIRLEFQSDTNTNFPAQIYDTMGRLLHEFEIPGYGLERGYSIDLSIFSPGVYYLKVKNQDEVIAIPLFKY